MKGVIESFFVELDRGIISADDGNRYNFSSSNWKDTKESPQRGLRVVFKIEEKKAVEIYLAKGYGQFLGFAGSVILFFLFLIPVSAVVLPNLVDVVVNLMEVVVGCRGRPRGAEGRNYAGTINRAQQAYYLEKQRFSYSLEDLGLRVDPENYDVAISEADEQKAVAIVTAKEEYLESFAAAISFSDSDSSYYNTIVCRTIEPSKEIAAPIFNDYTFKCAAGSEEIN